MKRLFVLSLSVIALVPIAVHAQNEDQARAFVTGIYAEYGHAKTSAGPNILGAGADKLFSPQLLQLVRKSIKDTPQGDAPTLDFDPVCACQDSGGLRVISLDVKVSAASTAVAVVLLRFPDAPKGIRVELSLKWFPNGWRIDEISTKDVPSLRKLLLTGS